MKHFCGKQMILEYTHSVIIGTSNYIELQHRLWY